MKPPILFLTLLIIILVSCKKDAENPELEPEPETILSDKTLILDKNISSISLIEVDSTKIIFAATGTDLSKIKVGSILVSDMNDKAPNGFLRRVTSVMKSDGKITCETVQASLTDAIVKGSVSFKKTFTDNDILDIDSSGVDISLFDKSKSAQIPSFSFSYKTTIYDSDQKKETIDDQIYVEGKIQLEPTIYFDLDIENSKIKYFRLQMDLKNLIHVKATAKIKLPVLNDEQVLYTFPMAPYTIPIAGIPMPIAKQWIVLVLGIDGNISAKMVCGAQNTNTVKAGIIYEYSSWDVFTGVENSFELVPTTFEGEAKIEPWLQARYEIRPYALQRSRIFIGAKGSVIGEAKLVPQGLDLSLKWGVKLTAKAQMIIFDKSILNYENEIYTKEFPIKQWSSYAFPTLSTISVSNITQSSAASGGNVTSDGGAMVTVKGVCWNKTGNPTLTNKLGFTSDGSGTNNFSSNITGLNPSTKYYVCAYATNSQGTGYGNQVSFTTSSAGYAPNADFNASPTSITEGQSVQFTDKSTYNPTDWVWDFGDGKTSTVQNPTHVYNNAGIYTITLMVSNSFGHDAKTLENYVNVSKTSVQPNSFTDSRDGKTYKWVQIGSQIWMAENLAWLPKVSPSSAGSNTVPYYYVYNYNGTNVTAAKATDIYRTYGVLYNLPAALSACPAGWHLPSDTEWKQLEIFLGMTQSQADLSNWRDTEVGTKLKATSGWNLDGNGTNSSGFSALPGGQRATFGFSGIWIRGFWLSSTEWYSTIAWSRGLGYSGSNIYRGPGPDYDECGYSVRCVKD